MFQQEAGSEGVQPNVNPSLQPNHESGGVQPNVNPSLQPNLDSVPRAGSSEEPQLSQPQSAADGGVQPNVNPGGSAHHPQLTETQSAPNEIGTAEHLKYYRSLHNAAKIGDCESAKSFIEKDPNALTARITVDSKTVLHVAALCDQWEFILQLLELVSIPMYLVACRFVMSNGFAMITIWTWFTIAMSRTMWIATGELICDVIGELIWDLVFSGFAIVQDKKGNTVLHYVAEGGSLKTAKALVQKNAVLPQIGNNKRVPPLLRSIWSENKELVWYLSSMTSLDLSPYSTPYVLHTLILTGYHAPFVNMVRDAKLKHECAVELVNHVCTQLSNMSFQEIYHFLTNPNFNILDSAIKCGIEEIVRTLLLQFPDLISIKEVLPNRNILQAAIEYRQENIVNVIKEISTTTTKKLGSYFIESKGVTLHLAGKLAPAFKLFSVSGAALQMQRELQWFKVSIMSNYFTTTHF
ncbi:hypothetical protein EZV62_003557 [Acer yangbiense]|uniref:Uncharacterized protein n=1 Tax=Acer yangbiense TaxID=1000413 RepID=A0A5C7IIY2_9ROSI|nr:hypothetical protein EZV62_003557 [Acer yangbiense]